MKNQNSRPIKAPTGTQLNTLDWQTEAPLRMLMNNLDPNVAEDPDSLIVYGGIGRAARNWACFDKMVDTLKRLKKDETLLVQSGKPVGVFRTHERAPRVLIANSNLVPHWATWEHFHELDKKGLMMYGQMTAGSWIYIGSQGIVQGTFETFMAAGQKHFQSNLEGKWILTSGLGGMGGAQPLAGTMAGACVLAIECCPNRIQKRLEQGYLDHHCQDLDEAMSLIQNALEEKQAISVGLLGNASSVLPQMLEKSYIPDLLTDQTSAHDPLNGYLPKGWTLEQWETKRVSDPDIVIKEAKASMASHVRSLLAFQKMGVPTFDYGNNLRQVAYDEGVKDAFDIPGFVPEYIRPLFCEGKGPFRWAALSGDPNDIYETDKALKALFPDNHQLHQWLDMAREKIQFQGLPARICWLGLGDREKAGLAFNQLVKDGKVKAPLVIGRDHLDSGSVASPNRETEGMLDGSDAVSDWPILNALLNCASGATWVSFHHGGGVGMGFSQHSGFVLLCDGSDLAHENIKRVLHHDPATGVMRHADAGYDLAIQCAKEQQLDLPMLEGQ